MYEFAPLAPQIWGEQPFQSPPKLGDLGGINMINKIKFIFQFSNANSRVYILASQKNIESALGYRGGNFDLVKSKL